jgi:bifunctional DNA-binding transcriptional regulator/antitoxin component of YhaV-PrlF toxin-antitoxin module
MWINAAEVLPDGRITLPADICNKMELTAGDHIALIYDNNRVIMRKATSDTGIMTFEEFLIYRDVKIKNFIHERIVKAFYVYLESVTGNSRLLPDLVGRLVDIDASSLTVQTGCFNGISDGTEPPYDDVDFYIKLSNGICLFIYGSIPSKPLIELRNNEYALFMLSNDINGSLERKANRYIYLTKKA